MEWDRLKDSSGQYAETETAYEAFLLYLRHGNKLKAYNTRQRERAEKSGKSFETKVESIKEIVEKFEDGDLTLNELLKNYKKGVSLIKECNSILGNFEEQIEELEK